MLPTELFALPCIVVEALSMVMIAIFTGQGTVKGTISLNKVIILSA